MDNIDIKDRFLENGLRLISLYKPGDLMSFNIAFSGGAIDDGEDKKGLTHFLEHMLFTGTINRDHKSINKDLEQLAGIVDAYTDINSLTITINCLNEEMERVLDITSDMIRNSIFPIKEVNREKNVILSEYREGLEDLESVSYDHLYDKAFKKNRLYYSVIGDEETISSFSREDLVFRYDELIRPNRATLVLVSPYSHVVIEELVKKYYSSWESKEVKNKKIKPLKNIRGSYEIIDKGFEMSTLSILFSFPNLKEEYEGALKIINNKLGDSDNSLLFNEVRLKRGLCYDVYSSIELSKDLKTLEIYCATERDNIGKVERVIKKTISDFKKGIYPIDDETLILMKKILKTNITTLTDDTFGLGSYILSNAIEGKDLLNYKNEFKKLEALDQFIINKVLNDLLKNPTVVVLNP